MQLYFSFCLIQADEAHLLQTKKWRMLMKFQTTSHLTLLIIDIKVIIGYNFFGSEHERR